MSDFQLDVDSPYPRPTREDLMIAPRKMNYSQGPIRYKHYGKYVGRMLRALGEETNHEAVNVAVEELARYMRAKSFEYNQEHPNNEIIIKDIKQMSEGTIELDEIALNNLRSDYKQHLSQRAAKPQQRTAQKAGQKNQQKNQHSAQRNKPNQRQQKK